VAIYRREAVTPPLASNGQSFRAVLSTGGIALDGHTIDPAGWELTNYLNNPVLTFNHDLSTPPIGRATDIGVTSDKTKLVGEFRAADNPLAATVFGCIAEGVLNATSVSWTPISFKYATAPGRAPGAIDFQKQSLLECAVVVLPSDPACLITARAAGIDTHPIAAWAGRHLDQGTGTVNRRTLEAVYRSTKRPASIYDLCKQGTIADKRKLLRMKAYDAVSKNGGPVPACFLPPADDYEREARRAGALLDLQRGTRRASAGLARAESNSDVASDWKCAASHGLPVAATSSFDADAAAARIFEASGFDTGTANSVTTRQAFLFYDAAAPGLRDSYLLPFADMVNGTLTATNGGIDSAATALPKAKVSDALREEAQAVIDHYRTKMEVQEEARSIFNPTDHARKERERRERLRRLQNAV